MATLATLLSSSFIVHGVEKEQVAIIFAGGVSRGYDNSPLLFYHTNSLYNANLGEHANVGVCARSIQANLVRANLATHRFDFFIHSWNPELRTRLDALYNFSSARYEDNRPYENALRPLFETRFMTKVRRSTRGHFMSRTWYTKPNHDPNSHG